MQCSPYQAIAGKIYRLKQHFLLPAMAWRFTKIKEVLLKNTQVGIWSNSHMPQGNEWIYGKVQWNPVNMVTNGSNKIGCISMQGGHATGALTGDRFNKGIFIIKWVAVLPYYQGGHKVGFHCTQIFTAFLFMGHAFWKENVEDMVNLLESIVLNCCVKVTMVNLCKMGLKVREWHFRELSS